LQGRNPLVSIFQPTESAHFAPDDVVVLAGDAYDPEDGDLDDPALIWGSDRDGQLGSGGLLTLAAHDLTPGRHLITLAATDGDGQTGLASVEIFVDRARIYLPLVMRAQ